jgi:tetratricopeptide (TPR) repeat protein
MLRGIVALLVVFSISGVMNSIAQAELLRACAVKEADQFCPSLSDEKLSDSQVLFYVYNHKESFEKAKKLFNQGVRLEEKGELRQAKFYYLKAINVFPEMVEAYLNLGSVLLCLNEYDNAIYITNRALKLSSNYRSILYNNLGLAYEGKKDFVKAIDYYELSINLNPQSAMAHNNLATLYLRLRQYDKAREEINIVKSLSPELASNLEF